MKLLSLTSVFSMSHKYYASTKSSRLPALLSLGLLTACGSDGGTDSNTTLMTDTTAPVITLNGSTLTEHAYATVYSDAGVTVTDNIDDSDDISVTVSGADDIDVTDLEASYTITYTATDSAGNTITATRTVSMVYTGPVISINGSEITEHDYGTVYSDTGATAIDDTGEYLEVTTSGDDTYGETYVDGDALDTSYSITYSATDSDGAESTVIRTVTVGYYGPVISFSDASDDTELGQGRPYFELEASAYDYLYETTYEVSINTGEMLSEDDTADTLGTYEVSYSAVGDSGISKEFIHHVDVVERRPFITTWDTRNTEGSYSDEYTLKLSINPDLASDYYYQIDCGDDSLEGVRIITAVDAYCSYVEPGIKTVEITDNIENGSYPQLFFVEDGDEDYSKLLTVEQWGDVKLTSAYFSFAFTTNLTSEAIDTPDLREVTDMIAMFLSATAFNADVSNWDVNNVTTMRGMFYRADAFNGELNDWDVSNVMDMSYMFYETELFNQSLSDWDVSHVTNMSDMFYETELFNQSLNDWDVSNVTDMNRMFYGTELFNQSLNDWDVSNVTDMGYMFAYTTTFNQDLSAWQIPQITNLEAFLAEAPYDTAYYDALLFSFAEQADSEGGVQNNVDFSYTTTERSVASDDAVETLEALGWLFKQL